MDPAPDGTQIVGGAAPGRDGTDRDGGSPTSRSRTSIASPSCRSRGQPRVVRGLDLRLYPGAPYGAEPSAEALSPTESGSTSRSPG